VIHRSFAATIQFAAEKNYGKGESWHRRRHRDKGGKIDAQDATQGNWIGVIA
jgi:hypothetical protein